MKPSLQTIANALQLAWSADTAYDPLDWSEENKARGQCLVSSLVVQDYLGGELASYSVNEDDLHETHHVNRLNGGGIVDITASQYKQPVNMRIKPVHLDGFETIRAKRLADDSTRKRYEILKDRVEHILANN